MDNYINDGTTMLYTNGGGATIASGTVVLAKHTLGVALADIAVGETGVLKIKGRVTAPKVSGAAFVAGEKLIWDISANTNTGAFDDSSATPATGDITGAAVAAAAGTDGQTTCEVILTPGNVTVT
jgi:predicted RecA/RadA family phage recombinase